MLWLVVFVFLVAVVSAVAFRLVRREQETRRKAIQHVRQRAVAAGPYANLTWIGAGQSLSINGMRLDGANIYVFDSRGGLKNSEPAAIDLALPIASHAEMPTQRELAYFPKYAGFTPAQRLIYLEWLAGERNTPPPELGYAFLFIYGLERRALVEGADHKIVFDELLRLRQLYANDAIPSRSFDGYIASLLCFLIVLAPQAITLNGIAQLFTSIPLWTEDYLSALLAWFAITQTPLPDWAAFAVAKGLPQSQRSVVINRVGGEFQKLFGKRYVERFPGGMLLSVPKRQHKYAYRPASAALRSMSVVAPHLWGVAKSFRPLSDLWNDGIAELRKLSSVVAKSSGQMTVAGWEAMPADLQTGTDHPLAERFCDLIDRHMAGSGGAVVPASELAAALDISGSDRITPGQARKLCDRAADVGYNLEPDARLTGKGYRGDEPVAVFLRLSEESVDPARYSAAACMLRIGLAIVAADGEADEAATRSVAQHVRSAFDLSEDEQRRLEALRGLLVLHGPDLAGLGKIARSLSPPQCEMIGKLAIALAAEDGVITTKELRTLRKCSTALGLQKQQIDHALRSLATTARSDEPVTVQPAEPRVAGETIPPPAESGHAESPRGLRLDRVAITAIMKDTQEVAQMLAAAMGADEARENGDEDIVAPAPIKADVLLAASGPTSVGAIDPTLPQRYAALYQALVAWNGPLTIKQADGLARQHGHMLSGALEAINEWSCDRLGGQLFVEEGEHLILERELLA